MYTSARLKVKSSSNVLSARSPFSPRPFTDEVMPKTDSPDLQPKHQWTQQNRSALSRLAIYPSTAPIQPKLTVGAPGDRYEQEADAMAAQVMTMPDSMVQPEMAPEEEEIQTKPALQREAMPEEEEEEIQTKPLAVSITPLVQREAMPGEEEEEVQAKYLGSIQREEMPEEEKVQTKPALQRSPDGGFQAGSGIESRLSSSKGGGSPLSDEVRSFMEPRFGADFSQVRVHTGSEAVQMNRDLNAKAFTHKQDIYFGSGESPAKDALTAHELTHVMQQNGGMQSKISRQILGKHNISANNSPSIHLKAVNIQVRRPTLRQGSVGFDVLELQQKLKTQYPESDLELDSKFGLITRSEVERFQAHPSHMDEEGKPLVIDGIVGKHTWSALDQIASPPERVSPKAEAQRNDASSGSVSWIDPSSPAGRIPVFGVSDPKPSETITEGFITGHTGFRFSNYLHGYVETTDSKTVSNYGLYSNSGIYRSPSEGGFESQEYPTLRNERRINVGGVEGVAFEQLVGARTTSPAKTAQIIGGVFGGSIGNVFGGLVGLGLGALAGAKLGTYVVNQMPFANFPPIWTKIQLVVMADGTQTCNLLEHSLFPSNNFYNNFLQTSSYTALDNEQNAWQASGWGGGNPWGVARPTTEVNTNPQVEP
jgi:hypothetical protein